MHRRRLRGERMDMFFKIAAGALIPSFASVLFNYIFFFMDHFHETPMPSPDMLAWDVSIGCIFAVVGVAITAQVDATARHLFVLFAALVLCILALRFVFPIFGQLDRETAFW